MSEWSGNLPSETRSFVGRQDELARLDVLLRPDDGLPEGGERRRDRNDGRRLTTLLGPGGIGKTRLAVEAARRMRPAYPDGVWLVELSCLHDSGLTGPSTLGLATMEALRVADQTTRPATEALAHWIADKQLLLVLDSCEHLLEDCAAFVDELRLAPHVHILATSRRLLGLPGEQCLEVEPLPVNASCTATRDDAVTLFADRAAAVRSGFVLDETTRPVAVSVCRYLDGIPLAVELAAARLSTLSLTDLDDHLGTRTDHRLALLASDDGTEDPSRHQALRTTIGWSHELCAPRERLLWARLAVFTGGFDVDAAQEVCAGGPLTAGQVPVLLDELAAQSIVQRDHRTGTARFRMLDTVREYGAEWLRELGEKDAVRLRHREYYRRLARDGCAEWNTGRQVQWSARVLTDHANLRAAVDWSLDRPDRRAALEIAGTAGFLWRHCGHVRDAHHCLDRVLATDSPPGPDLLRALWTRGAGAIMQGDLDTAAEYGRRFAEAARQQEDPTVRSVSVFLTSGQLSLRGRPAEAIGPMSAAARLPVQDDWLGSAQIQTIGALAYAHLMAGDHAAARATAEEVRAECARRGEHWSRSTADVIVAMLDLARGDIASGVHNAARAVAAHGLLHSAGGLAALALDTLASATVAAGEAHRAAELLGIAHRLWDRAGGRAQLNSPDLIAARQACERAIRDKIGDPAYEHSYEAGRAMSYEQGMSYATDTTPRVSI
ncbi:ATP-binding protein [Streptomyces longisporoflavus]|uniref:ATP-binding protein n=1 Tax=Streptomyces longisporoflavus TaxID=28044 RepID=A0ABW7QZT4_9ACTN